MRNAKQGNDLKIKSLLLLLLPCASMWVLIFFSIFCFTLLVTVMPRNSKFCFHSIQVVCTDVNSHSKTSLFPIFLGHTIPPVDKLHLFTPNFPKNSGVWLICENIWATCHKFAKIDTFHCKFTSQWSKLIKTSFKQIISENALVIAFTSLVALKRSIFVHVIADVHFLALNCIKLLLQ